MLLAVCALGLQFVLDLTRTPVRQWDYELKLSAAQLAGQAFDAVRTHRGLEGANVDMMNDPAATGLIGPEVSLITNATGDLESKLTTLNPNFAAVLVGYFRQAGLKPGDPVAVAVSGSFPGMNICLYAAIEAMDLRPVVITSVGASNWGANDPSFTWLDMETVFFDQGIFHTRSAAATYGGGNDMGRGLSPAGRHLLQEAIDRNGVPLIDSANVEDAIAKRMTFYETAARGRAYRLYVNVGGGVASLGNSHNKTLLPTGLSFHLQPFNWPRKGTLILFADKGVPVVHLLQMTTLARRNGLPVAPDFQPQPGEGEIFVREMYRWPLAAAFLVLYGLTCVLVLAPEIRRGIFDRLGRRRPGPAALVLAAVVGGALGGAGNARAADQWVHLKPAAEATGICLVSQGEQFAYTALDPAKPLTFAVSGPRRVKLIARQVSRSGGGDQHEFTVIATLDGAEVARKSFTTQTNPELTVCSGDGQASTLRRVYVDIPKGKHTLSFTGLSPDGGQVAVRVFRQNKRQTSGTVPFAPEGYAELATMQFESGKQSTYYRFDATTPLTFAVTGPTTLQVYTRLDFGKNMLGSHSYALAVVQDGVVAQTFHYDSERLANGFYTERLDLLPGTRKAMKIKVPAGRHHIEVRCVRPDNCGVAAQIRIPRRDLQGHP